MNGIVESDSRDDGEGRFKITGVNTVEKGTLGWPLTAVSTMPLSRARYALCILHASVRPIR